MKKHKITRAVFSLFVGVLAGGIALIPLSKAEAQSYVSPFEINLTNAITSWTSDFATRGADITNDSQPAPANWYSTDYGQNPSYGPILPQLYSSSSVPDPSALNYDRGNTPVYNVPLNGTAPGGVSQTTYDQERLLYAAQQLIGTAYQHTHLPEFNGGLAANFVWNPVTTNTYLQTSAELKQGATSTIVNPYKATYGLATNGIDCTDFAAYIYNKALGIQMHSGTFNQIEFINAGVTNSFIATNSIPTATVLSSNGTAITPNFIKSPTFGTTDLNTNDAAAMSAIEAQLRPGDLLYMRSSATNITHVVVWLGDYGMNSNGTASDVPLIISSHDNTPAIFNTTNVDSLTGLPRGLITNGSSNNITDFLPPPGVEILPFDSNNWFYQNFSVAMQVLPVPEPSSGVLLGLAAVTAALLLVLRKKRC